MLSTALLISVLFGQSSPPQVALDPPTSKLARIRPSADRTHFVLQGSDKRFLIWGFNYDHDDAGRLLEDYWESEWSTVVEDFREMKALGVNVVRVHLQVAKFMRAADVPYEVNFARLAKLVALAEETGLYLDVTGLGCYHKQDVPAWYDALDESDRWDVQTRFWKAVAGVCKASPAIFCYDLMNEPILAGGEGKTDWLPGKPLAGKYFVQRITIDAKGRADKEIARQWVERLTSAIRSVDHQTMITVGVIPWAQIFEGAKPLFYAPEVCGPLDFVSVHLYPRKGKIDDDLKALKVYEVGKPMVVEEIFPLTSSFEETLDFIERSRTYADGWISFYWGKTTAEYDKVGDLKSAIVSGWLKRFGELAAKNRQEG